MAYVAAQLLLAAVIGSSSSDTSGPTPACKGQRTDGASRRACTDTIVSNVTTAGDCEALCCADSVAHPVPYPGAVPVGCVAWYHSEYSQCFMCNGVNRHGKAGPWPPVANETDPKCVPRKSWKNPGAANITCMTGTITPTPAPLPPKPPAVFKGFIGTEAHPEYVDGAVGMRAPTRVGNSSEPLNATTELTDKGWPKMDCDITIFDHRPTHAWAPPMDDPEHRQVDLSGTWTLSKKSAAVAVAVAAAVVAETNSC